MTRSYRGATRKVERSGRVRAAEQSDARSRRRRGLLRWLLPLGLFAALAGGVRAGATMAEAEAEYDVKAAFLLNFARFIEWPKSAFEQPGSPFRIAVVGADPFGASLDRVVAGKSVEGHPIVVKRVSWGASLQEYHIVFFARSERERTSHIPAALKDAPTLAVGDTPGFAKHGGEVGFYLDQNRVRFEVNLEAMRRRHLTASSRLLALARIVRD